MHASLAKILLRLCALLPLPLAHGLGNLLGLGMWLFPNEQRRVAAANLKACFPELDDSARARLLRQALREIGKTVLESGIIWFASPKRLQSLVRATSGEELIAADLRQGKGVLLAVPHLGNWEVVGLYCSARYPITSLYKPPRQAELGDVIRAARERQGAKLVPTTAQGVKALYQAIRDNGLVGILPDQDPRDGAGHFAPFFGRPAHTMVLLSRLAHKSGAPVVFACAERLSWGRGFHIHFYAGPASINASDLDASVGTVNAMVEKMVRTFPTQYQWGYKRFRTVAKDTLDVYARR